jgi:hypothetical protein
MAGRLSKLPANTANAAHLASNVTAGGDVKERAMKQYLFGCLAATLITGGLIGSAPPANAGCRYNGGWSVISQCDGPVQPDGTWQRCVVFEPTYNNLPSSGSNYVPNYAVGDKRCDVMGPDLHPWGVAFNDPPTHIDDSTGNPS